MAKKKPEPTVEVEKPVLAVMDKSGPVLCSPYEVPTEHYIYKDGSPYKASGRRPAGYWFTTKKVGGAEAELFAEEQFDELVLINKLRQDVERWRSRGYRGASSVTRELLDHWASERIKRRLFFCQREAIETVIYLLEIRLPGRSKRTGFSKFEVTDEDIAALVSGNKPKWPDISEDYIPSLADQPADEDYQALLRLGIKMATGAGKTVVMAMLITWAFANRSRNPGSTFYPNGVLICAPGLTVKKRLEVLKPDDPNNFYDDFGLVPPKYRDSLSSGKIHITNWHVFAAKSPNKEGDTTYRVVDKGEESNDAFTKDRLGDLFQRLPILVLNDEGHHCWRPKVNDEELTSEEKATLKDEQEEAKIWLDGLDRINNAGVLGTNENGTPKPCIMATVDLSATPYYIKGSGHIEGSPYPWLVSDFGLVDAIESGITKVPRLPVLQEGGTNTTDDAGRADPKYFRLWEHINTAIKPDDRRANGRPKPEAVLREAEGALQLLTSQWIERFKLIEAANPNQESIPPVMIVVCDNTETSRVFFQYISGQRIEEIPRQDGKKGTQKIAVFDESNALITEFANTETMKRTIQIDSKTLAELNAGDGTKDQATEALRAIVDSVGQPGTPGEHVRCVVSVSMLTEGWSANNVTHILGVRAFKSQLLCEQVVGRGLRRMNYTPDPETGLLPAEFVDVYGIPFSVIPFKGRPTDAEATEDKPRNHIYAVEDRSELAISIPVVESYTYQVTESGIDCDIDDMEGVFIDHEPVAVYLDVVRGYKDTAEVSEQGNLIKQNKAAFYEAVPFQQIVFEITRRIVDELQEGTSDEGDKRAAFRLKARQFLFPQVLKVVQEFIDKKVTFGPGIDKRELGLEKYAMLVKERIRDGIRPKAREGSAPILPVINRYKPVYKTDDVDYTTLRPIETVTKSHLNAVAWHSTWERDAAKIFDELDFVECFAPNDQQIGLRIPYDYMGTRRVYEPDFMVRIQNGPTVIVEIKGWAGERDNIKKDEVQAKNVATKKWVTAINNYGHFGDWGFEICREVDTLEQTLQHYISPALQLPFSAVEPKDDQLFVSCVPKMTLKAAAGYFSESQDVEIELWVRPHTNRNLEQGMFIAQVNGDSMFTDGRVLGEIPNGSWCLFRSPVEGSRQNKIVLVQHHSISDPVNGGQYTVKKYTSEKTQLEDGTWKHASIKLEPLNPDFEAIDLTSVDQDEVMVIAELVEVLQNA